MYQKRIKTFPKDFLFAAATSAFQVEGGVFEGNRGIAVHDLHPKKDGIADFNVASDHYHRYKEDIALMKELGLQAYRFSISWVRILPDGKNVNSDGIAYYKDMIQEIIRHGMQPIVTMYHFEYPQSLIDAYGGWLDRESITDFERYATILFENYGKEVSYWLTINEQDHLLKITNRLGFPESLTGKEYLEAAEMANYHMCVATAKVIRKGHEMLPNIKIGPVINPMVAIPSSNKPEDVIAAKEFDELSTYYILDLHCHGEYSPMHWKYMMDRNIQPEILEEDMKLMKDNPPDFIALNYYLNQTIAKSDKKEIGYHDKTVFIEEEMGIYKIVNNDTIHQTQWGWNICPEGLKIAIMDFYNRYRLPILITENGLGAYDTLEDGKVHDRYRVEYLAKHLSQIKDCLSMGYPVVGYCAWSFIDLVSGREGMDKRYGLVYVNRDNEDLKDLRRIKKDSFYWYQEVIKNRGYDL